MSVTLKTKPINIKDNNGNYQSFDMFSNTDYQEQMNLAMGAMDSKAREYESQMATNNEYYRMMAEAFNPEKDYAVGYYVLYTTTNNTTNEEETKLYRFIAPHNAGPWNNNQVREVRWGDDYFLMVDNYNKCYITNHIASYNGVSISYNYDGTLTLNGTSNSATYIGLMEQRHTTSSYSSSDITDYKSIQPNETYTFYRIIKSGTKSPENNLCTLRYREFGMGYSPNVNNGETINFGTNAALFLYIASGTTFTNYTLYLSAVKTLETPDLGEPGFCAKDSVARATLNDITQDGWNEFFISDLKTSRTFNGVTVTKNEDGTFTFNGTPTSVLYIPLMGCKSSTEYENAYEGYKHYPDPNIPYIVNTDATYYVKNEMISQGENSYPTMRIRYRYATNPDGSFTIANNKSIKLLRNCTFFLYITQNVTTINEDNEEIEVPTTFNNVTYRFMLSKSNTAYIRPLQKTAVDSFARDQLEDIENFSEGARGILPSYYFENNYIDNRIQKIQEISSTCGLHGDSFVWLTDPHLYWQAENAGNLTNYKIVNGLNAPKLLKMIKERANISKFFNGGDWLRGNTTHFSPARTLMSNCVQHYAPIWDNMYCLIGNHDWNNNPTMKDEHGEPISPHRYYNGEDNVNSINSALSLDELYSLMIKHQENNIVINDVEYSGADVDKNKMRTCDYYMDNTKQKIRYFFIGCPNGGSQYGGYFSPVSADWLKEQLLLVPDNYTVIILAHNIVGNAGKAEGETEYTVKSFSSNFNNLVPYLDALKRGVEWNDYNTNHKTVNIACVISGHKHRDYCGTLFRIVDEQVALETTIPYIITECDYCNGNNRSFKSITEQAFDVVQIDTTNKKMYFTRFGGCKYITKNELIDDPKYADIELNYETGVFTFFTHSGDLDNPNTYNRISRIEQ